jgi:acyl carrier protein phosphodiesterase
MNWLAHIFLSDDQIEYQLGNLLADLLKGKSWQGASPLFDKGLAMHREIDRYTDQHPRFLQSKARLGPQGRLKAVVVDITYDHLLAKNWQRYARMPLDDFIDHFQDLTQQVYANYPEEARQFLSRLIASGHLRHYQTFSGVEAAFRRVDHRLSMRALSRESAQDYLPLIKDRLDDIEQDFIQFMPDLIGHFKSVAGLSVDDHWLK